VAQKWETGSVRGPDWRRVSVRILEQPPMRPPGTQLELALLEEAHQAYDLYLWFSLRAGERAYATPPLFRFTRAVLSSLCHRCGTVLAP